MINKQREFPGGVWSEGEQLILDGGDLTYAVEYARATRRGPWPALERALLLEPYEFDYNVYEDPILVYLRDVYGLFKKRPKELVEKAKKNALDSKYPADIWNIISTIYGSKPWPEGEKALLEGPEDISEWPQSKINDWWLKYIHDYAAQVLYHHWPEGWEVIKKYGGDNIKILYADEFRLPSEEWPWSGGGR